MRMGCSWWMLLNSGTPADNQSNKTEQLQGKQWQTKQTITVFK